MLESERLTGPWAGLPVAWKEDFSFDEDVYRADVQRTCKAGVPGIYTGAQRASFMPWSLTSFRQLFSLQ